MVLFHYLFFSIRNFISFYIVIAELVSNTGSFCQ